MGFGRWGLRDASKNRTTTTINPLTGGYTSVQYTLSNGDNIGVINYPGPLGATSDNVLIRINLTQNTYSNVYTSAYPGVFKIDKIQDPNGNWYVYGASNDPTNIARIWLFKDDGTNLTQISIYNTAVNYFVPSLTMNNNIFAFQVPSGNNVQGYLFGLTSVGGNYTAISSKNSLTMVGFDTPGDNNIYYASTTSPTTNTHAVFGYGGGTTNNKIFLATYNASTRTFGSQDSVTLNGNITWITNDGTRYFITTSSGYIYRYSVISNSLTSATFATVPGTNNLCYAIIARNLFCCTSTDGFLFIINKDITFTTSAIQKYQIRNGVNATTNLRGLLYDSVNNYLLIPDNASKIYYFNLNTMQQESWAEL